MRPVGQQCNPATSCIIHVSMPRDAMHRSGLALLGAVLLGGVAAAPISAQIEDDLLAKRRVFPDQGPGLRAVSRDAAGNYYVLSSLAASVAVYNPAGERIQKIPPAAGAGSNPGLSFGEDLDVDAEGRVYVADRGGNAVKVFNRDGSPALTIAVASPTSVVALSGGKIAVASMKSARLVTVFDLQGKVVREFGDPSEAAERGELNRFLNIGRLGTDRRANIYYAFDYLPEPTVRKYDRHGYSAFEISLTALEFQPAAEAVRREIERQERGGAPRFKRVVTAVGVDPDTEEIWAVTGGLLLHFDREGNRRGTYRVYTPEGARIEATSVLVEKNRLLLGADPLGVYEFARPDQKFSSQR